MARRNVLQGVRKPICTGHFGVERRHVFKPNGLSESLVPFLIIHSPAAQETREATPG